RPAPATEPAPPPPVAAPRGHWTWVLSTKDVATWDEVLAFRAESTATDFELLRGDCYFAVGCTLLSLTASDWTAQPAAGRSRPLTKTPVPPPDAFAGRRPPSHIPGRRNVSVGPPQRPAAPEHRSYQ